MLRRLSQQLAASTSPLMPDTWSLIHRWSFSERIIQWHQLHQRPMRSKLARSLPNYLLILGTCARFIIGFVSEKYHRLTDLFRFDYTLNWVLSRHHYPPETALLIPVVAYLMFQVHWRLFFVTTEAFWRPLTTL